MPTSTKLRHYEQIAEVTEAMLGAARKGDWGEVLLLGQQYCELVEQLRTRDPGSAPLGQAERVAKHDLLVRILESDAATRDLAIPQLARLGELLGRMKRQQSLLRAYRMPDDRR